MIKIKRVYENAAKSDGFRVLVDRLWPRGVTKAEAAVDFWLKEAAPSKELIAWFHADKENRYQEFVKKYQAELGSKNSLIQAALKGKKKITLITSVKDIEHSHIPTLTSYLEKKLR